MGEFISFKKSKQSQLLEMRYQLVCNDKRKKLIELVYGPNSVTTRVACQELGINLSTAKYILKIYRRQGRSYRKTRAAQSMDLKPELKSEYKPVAQVGIESPGSSDNKGGAIKAEAGTDKNFNEDALEEEKKQESIEEEGQPGEFGNQVFMDKKVIANLRTLQNCELSYLLKDYVNKITSQSRLITNVDSQLQLVNSSFALLERLYKILREREAQIKKSKEIMEKGILPCIIEEIVDRKNQEIAQNLIRLSSQQMIRPIGFNARMENSLQHIGQGQQLSEAGATTPELLLNSEGAQGENRPATPQ